VQHHGKAQMKLFKLLSIVIVPIGLAACGSVSKLTQDGTSTNRDLAEISPESWSPIPTCVRLKLAKQEESVKFIDSDYRESLSAHLIAKGYMLTQSEDCSFVFSSTITQNSRGFFGVFSKAVLSAQANLKDTKQNKMLWSAASTVDFSDGALPFSLIGISTGIYKASESLTREKELMAIDSLARKLMTTLPYLPVKNEPLPAQDKQIADIDKWLSEIAEIDRPQALKQVTEGAYSNQLKEKAYVRLVQLQNSAVNRRLWAHFKASTGQHEEAINVLLDGTALTQRDPESQFLLGRLYSALSRYQDADQAYMRASSLNPNNALYLEGLAYVNTKVRNYPRALAAYEKILQLGSAQSHTYLNMGEINLSVGQFSEAIVNYSNAADISFAANDTGALQKVLKKQQEIHALIDSSHKSESDQLGDKVSALLKRLEGVK
jgi:tetratricopeptide (TPR) repeat protein